MHGQSMWVRAHRKGQVLEWDNRIRIHCVKGQLQKQRLSTS
jgi:hypothetical protein